jgi:structural maintenance of chromosome 2
MINKDIVFKDKAMLENVLTQMDERKEQTVKKAFDKVNTMFGKIFSSLLKGASSRLNVVDPDDLLGKGIEMQVAFNGVWKDSLSELSGGQCSLLALSFILAMLKVKPAPLYILDEVDAALDVENTQNIGDMIKKHFPES